ncbi:hypothetical protein PIB30_030550 [Stylosanthes scabra]|uniref:Uncharacterized protein n=1 Tax=Stylosanthes scabra TaxID=79078 RepID=A0ABU6RBU4_9FABA|nr:hypothetical protein [Stylosanthes scabra]
MQYNEAFFARSKRTTTDKHLLELSKPSLSFPWPSSSSSLETHPVTTSLLRSCSYAPPKQTGAPKPQEPPLSRETTQAAKASVNHVEDEVRGEDQPGDPEAVRRQEFGVERGDEDGDVMATRGKELCDVNDWDLVTRWPVLKMEARISSC